MHAGTPRRNADTDGRTADRNSAAVAVVGARTCENAAVSVLQGAGSSGGWAGWEQHRYDTKTKQTHFTKICGFHIYIKLKIRENFPHTHTQKKNKKKTKKRTMDGHLPLAVVGPVENAQR
jgi:hypothetical protein